MNEECEQADPGHLDHDERNGDGHVDDPPRPDVRRSFVEALDGRGVLLLMMPFKLDAQLRLLPRTTLPR